MGFSDLLRSARSRDDYWIEDAIIRFTVQLYSRMKGMSQEELAQKVGAKQPYIARILKGKNNYTIATMVKLARAVGGQLDIVIRDGEAQVETGISELPLTGSFTYSLKLSTDSTAITEFEAVH